MALTCGSGPLTRASFSAYTPRMGARIRAIAAESGAGP